MNVQDKFSAFRDAVYKLAPDFRAMADGPEWLLLWYPEMNADLDFTDVVDLKLTSKPSHIPRQEFSVRFHHKSPDAVLISYLVEDPDSFFEAKSEWRSVGLEDVESVLRFMVGKFRTLVDQNAAVDLVAATKRRMGTDFFWRYRHDPDAVESSWICNPNPGRRAELVNFGGRVEWEVTLTSFEGELGFAFTTTSTDLHESEIIARLEPVLKKSDEEIKNLGKAGFANLFS